MLDGTKDYSSMRDSEAVSQFRRVTRECLDVKPSRWKAFKDMVTFRHTINRELNTQRGVDAVQMTNAALRQSGVFSSLSGSQVSGTTALGKELLTGAAVDGAQVATDALGLVSSGLGAGLTLIVAANEFRHMHSCSQRVSEISSAETVIRHLAVGANAEEASQVQSIQDLATIAKEMNAQRAKEQKICGILDSISCACAIGTVATSAFPPVALGFMAVGVTATATKMIYKYGGAVKRTVKGWFSKSARAENRARAAELNRKQNLVADQLSMRVFGLKARLTRIAETPIKEGETKARATQRQVAQEMLQKMENDPKGFQELINTPDNFESMYRLGLLERDEAAAVNLAMSLGKSEKNVLDMGLDEFNIYMKKQVRNK